MISRSGYNKQTKAYYKQHQQHLKGLESGIVTIC